jgi:hypothetical protein
MLPEDKQEFAAQLRRRQLQRQLPLHDLDPRFCSSLGEKEAAKYDKFSDKRRKKAAGIGQIGEVSSAGQMVTRTSQFFIYFYLFIFFFWGEEGWGGGGGGTGVITGDFIFQSDLNTFIILHSLLNSICQLSPPPPPLIW